MGKIANYWLPIAVCILDLFRSIYSSKFYQEIDWPCYSLDGKRLLNGDFDYQNYICEWGMMYYPAGFAYVYAFLQFISQGDVSLVIWIHICKSVIIAYLSVSLFHKYMRGKEKFLYLLVPLLSQNIYRAGISRVTNDLHIALFIIVMLHCLVNKQYKLASLLFTWSVSFKMNALFYGPSLLLLYLYSMPFLNVFLHFLCMGIFQIVVASPFLYSAPLSYLKLAFNFGRDFEHRVNMAWGFLGDTLRHDKVFYAGLLFCTVYFLLLFYILFFILVKRFKSLSKKNKANNVEYTELVLWLFIIPNFICYTFSRGVHIQFLLWIHYSLIYLFTSASQLPIYVGFPLYLLFDWCHSWVPNVIQLSYVRDILQSLTILDWRQAVKLITSSLFTQLKSLSYNEAVEVSSTSNVYKIVGGYYTTNFSIGVIPASFILFSIELFILYRLFHRIFVILSNKT